MNTKTKSRIKITLLALGAALMILLPLLLSGCGDPKRTPAAASPTPAPTVSPSPTPTPAPSPSPSATPTPATPTMTQEIMDKMIKDALAKAIPSPTPAKMDPIPIPEEIYNPFETDESRALRAARKGIAVVDENGVRWALISRDDGVEVTKGLPIETVTIASGDNVPFVAKEGDGWKVRWKKPDSARPTPNPLLEPSASPSPTPAPHVSPNEPPA